MRKKCHFVLIDKIIPVLLFRKNKNKFEENLCLINIYAYLYLHFLKLLEMRYNRKKIMETREDQRTLQPRLNEAFHQLEAEF